MKNIKMILITIAMSILLIGIANAYVESSEFVTYNDWDKMVASMSERLEYLSNEYTQKLVVENPKAKEIHDRAEKQQSGGNE